MNTKVGTNHPIEPQRNNFNTLVLARLGDERLPRIAVTFAAILFAAMFFYTALARLGYRYDLDFDEDSILMESLRVAQGLPIFVAPNADFDPHVYMPLFFWLGGLVLKLTGPSLPALRLISFTATLATTLLIYYIARRESRHVWIGIACAGLFLGGYRINGFWYDVVRVDSLSVALMLGGLTLAIYTQGSSRRLMLSGLILALAAFTKQSGLFVGFAFGLYLFIPLGRRAWLFIITFGTLTLVPLLALNVFSNGWFFYHVFTIAFADPIEFTRVVNFVAFDLFGVMAALSVVAVAVTFISMRRVGLNILREQPWLVAMALAILISGLGRARVGGNLNDRTPAYALLSLAPALLLRDWQAPLLRWREALIATFILIQFALGVYNPVRYIPTAQMSQSGDSLIQRIASIDGPVLVSMHPYYALLAGKEPSAQAATLWYVRDRGALPLPDDFVNRLRGKYYAAIISDETSFETDTATRALLDTNYVRAETLDPDESPPTRTGVVVQPMVIYRPKGTGD